MTNLRRLTVLIGAVLFAAGAIGLFVPVTVADGVGCGSAVHSDLSAASTQDDRNIGNSPVVQHIPVANQLAPQSQYVASCNSAFGTRRLWTISLVVIGIAAVGWSVVRRRESAARGI